MKYSAEIVFDTECGDFWIYVNGEVEGFGMNRSEAESKLSEILARMERHDREYTAQVALASVPCVWLDAIEAEQEVWEKAA